MLSRLEWPSTALPAAGDIDAARWLVWGLGASAIAAVVLLSVTPWQQSVRGGGRVIAYAPLDRQQAVEAPIDGRVADWYVQEGDRVRAGQPLALLADNDPAILDRLRQERDSARVQIDAAQTSIAMTEARIGSLDVARASAVDSARQRISMARDRQAAALQAVDAAEATLRTAELNVQRQRGLFGKGLTSQRDLELAELSLQTAKASRDRALAGRRASESEVAALSADKQRVSSSNQAGIESAGSSLQKLRADRAKAEAELAKIEVRLSRQQQMEVTAPRAGTILRVLGKQGTEMVKAGDPLLLFVPDARASAVELYVDGNDAPLIDEGRHVRLQFEGWPAVQFVGWPSVAVGTFPGTVSFVDSHDDGKGRFRLVVVPDGSEEWPSARYLRQGVRANGWVLLNQVSLGFELWRQFNGFPPSVSPPGGEAAPGKKGKG